MPTFAGNYTPEEYNALQDNFNKEQEVSQDLRARLDDVNEQLRRHELANDAARVILDEIDVNVNNGHIPEVAAELAKKKVGTTLQDQKAKEIADTLLEQTRNSIQEEINTPEWVSQRRKAYEEMFQQDGTFEKIREEESEKADNEVEAKVRADFTEKVLADFSDPEVEKVRLEEAKIKFAKSEAAKKLREEIESDFQQKWNQGALELFADQVTAEVESGKEEFIEDFIKSYPHTRDGKRLIQCAKEEAEKLWQDDIDAVAKALGDEKLMSVLKEKAAAETARIEQGLLHDKLAAEFQNGGVDTLQIAKDTSIGIYLGFPTTAEVTKKDNYGNHRNFTVPAAKVLRKLALTSVGNGRFVVNKDSLEDSENKYAASQSIPAGTVIAIGHKMHDKTKEKIDILDTRIRKDVPFYYDDNTNNDSIVNAEYPVVDLQVGDIYLRDGIEKRVYELL